MTNGAIFLLACIAAVAITSGCASGPTASAKEGPKANTSVAPSEPAATEPTMRPEWPPVIKVPGGVDWYPPKARRSGLEGRVLVAFDITAAGRVRNASILW